MGLKQVPFNSQGRPFEPRVGPYEPQGGPFEARVNPFEFRVKRNAPQRTQRALLVPLFTNPDNYLKANLSVNFIIEECGADVVDSKDPRVAYVG